MVPGLLLGLVTDVSDPEALARIKVSYPALGEGVTSSWAPLATLAAGGNRGTFSLPQIGDAVIVGFLSGDINQPCVLGALYSGAGHPAVAREQQPTTTEVRTLGQSRLTFVDGDAPSITIIDKNSNQIRIDVEDKRITISSQGEVSITAAQAMSLSGATVSMHGTESISISAPAVSISGTDEITASGGVIRLN